MPADPAMTPMTEEWVARFWSKVRKSPAPDGCWEWTRSTNHGGYGQIRINTRGFLAHRVSWVMRSGPIPEGLWVLHRCDNPPCVRPDHLFLGDRRDNMLDCSAKGRLGGMPRINRAKTQCNEGHPYDEKNTAFAKDRGVRLRRKCRECERLRWLRKRSPATLARSALTAEGQGEVV